MTMLGYNEHIILDLREALRKATKTLEEVSRQRDEMFEIAKECKVTLEKVIKQRDEAVVMAKKYHDALVSTGHIPKKEETILN